MFIKPEAVPHGVQLVPSWSLAPPLGIYGVRQPTTIVIISTLNLCCAGGTLSSRAGWRAAELCVPAMLARPATPTEFESEAAKREYWLRRCGESLAAYDAAFARLAKIDAKKKADADAQRAAEEQKARLAAFQEAQRAAARVARRPPPGELMWGPPWIDCCSGTARTHCPHSLACLAWACSNVHSRHI